MKLHCQLEPDDYIRAQYLQMRLRPVFKWLVLLFLLPAFALAIVGCFFTPHGLLIAGGLVAAIAYFVFILLVRVPRRTRKIFRQQKLLQEPYETVIDENTISATSAHGSFQLPWKDFHKYRVGKDLVLLYQSDAIYQMFAKRWFTDAEYEEFLGILKNALGEPK